MQIKYKFNLFFKNEGFCGVCHGIDELTTLFPGPGLAASTYYGLTSWSGARATHDCRQTDAVLPKLGTSRFERKIVQAKHVMFDGLTVTADNFDFQSICPFFEAKDA